MSIECEPEAPGAEPDKARGVAGVPPARFEQSQEDLTMLLALYRQTLAASGNDAVRAFGLVEAALAQDGIGEERAVGALTAAAGRLAGLETKVVRLLLELADGG